MNEPGSENQDERIFRKGGLAFGVPSLLLAGPIAGFLLGYWAVKLFDLEGDAAKRAKIIGILVGLVSGAYEAFKVIRKISKD